MTRTTMLIDLKPQAVVTYIPVTYSILVPTKGLERPIEKKFKSVGVSIEKDHPRSIESRISGIPPLTRSISCRSDLVPMMLARGNADFGITTTEVVDSFVAENTPWRFARELVILAKLNISRSSNGDTRIVFFGREGDANTIRDAALDFDEEKEGVPRIATEHPVQTMPFLQKHGMDFPVYIVRGSAEALVQQGFCRYGVTLVETGTTLKVNGLREIATICTSSTVLVANASRLKWDGGERRTFAELLCARLEVSCQLP